MSNEQRLYEELAELKQQLNEANDMIEAIRSGQVDALVVENAFGHQLYTLQSADQNYRIFIEKMKEGAVTLNEHELIIYSNSQFAEMVGLPLEKVIGLPLFRFIPEPLQAFFSVIITAAWNSDSRAEIDIQDSNGVLIPVVISGTSLTMDDRKALNIIFTDLSVQKENEKQLKIKNEQLEEARQKVAVTNAELELMVLERTRELYMSREHFKFLSDNIPVIVWTADPDGKIDYANKKWYDYTGQPEATLTTNQLLAMIHEDERAALIDNWKKARDTNSRFFQDVRLKGGVEGQFRYHLVNAYPYQDENGRVLIWIGTMIDIQRQRNELEKKDEFIGIASHELRTPLTSLKGYVQLIERDGVLKDPLSLYVRKANEAIAKLHHLVNDLLDVSKIQAGKLQFTKAPVDLCDLVKNCVENSQHVYTQIKFQEQQDDSCVVLGNEERLEQVLMNLINNAVKYSGGHSVIIVSITKNTKEVTVSVTDHGIGLAKEELDKVFERFYRVKDDDFKTSGLGMGLYISSQIVKEHGGEMDVKSKLNEGSVFSFRIPLISQPVLSVAD